MSEGAKRDEQGSVGGREPFFSGQADASTVPYDGTHLGPGSQIGPFRLLGILGEGGYGLVYLAEQERPLRRRVALKVIKPGMDSRQVIARFEAERQALALLDHPHIAHVYDAGTTQAGRPYFAMEHVEGVPITRFCDRERLPIKGRLSLFLQVCSAIQHAHQKGIIHRDLKPSNILVTAKDDRPLVKVIDFGVAKALGQPLTEKTLYTEQGQFIGTPDYMSPEQAEMDPEGIDTRSDVYSLGVVLYELLTGVLPFDPQELRSGGIGHIRTVIREHEPRTPSTRLTGLGEEAKEIAERRQTELRILVRSLQRELEWIPLKAMGKEPDHRYQSVSDLAGDIENYLAGLPLSAGPESRSYRLRKFVRRHRLTVAASLVIALVICMAMAVVLHFYLNAKRVTETQRQTLYYKAVSLADAKYKHQSLTGIHDLLQSAPADLRGWEWDRLQYVLDESLYSIEGHTEVIDGVVRSANGKHIWSCSRDNTIRCWDLATGHELHRINDPCMPMTIAISHSGARVATGYESGHVTVWDAIGCHAIQSWRAHKAEVRTLCFDCSESRLLSTASGDRMRIWDVSSGQQLMEKPCTTSTGGAAVWSPDCSQLATVYKGKAVFYDAHEGVEIRQLQLHESRSCHMIRYTPDGSSIVVCGQQIWVYDVDSGSLKGALAGSQAYVNTMELSPDGGRVVTGDELGFINVWDLSSSSQVATLRGHVQEVLSITFSTDGTKIISSGNEAIKIWHPTIDRKYLDLLGHRQVCSIAFSPDSSRLVSAGGENGTLKVWDLVSGSEVLTLCGHEGRIWSAVFTPDGTQIISGGEDKTLRLWDAHHGDPSTVLEAHEEAINAVAASPDNRWIASASADHTIRLWNRSDGRHVRTLCGHRDEVTCIAFDSDAGYLASGSLDHSIRVWDITTGQAVAQWTHDKLDRPNTLAFSPDGTVLLSGRARADQDLRFPVRGEVTGGRGWRTVAGGKGWNIVWNRDVGGSSLQGWNRDAGGYSPDGKRFVHRGHLDLEIRDSMKGDAALVLTPRCTWYGRAVFSPDGKTLATSGYAGGIGIIETEIPVGGFQIRQSAQTARILVDELYAELKSYAAVIGRIQSDPELDVSARGFALQISRSRLSAETYYATDGTDRR